MKVTSLGHIVRMINPQNTRVKMLTVSQGLALKIVEMIKAQTTDLRKAGLLPNTGETICSKNMKLITKTLKTQIKDQGNFPQWEE